ncbi:MAG TPA: hypothetical protein VD926_04490, partial [Acidimicrobiales bacterium]|nr:hypothetical protein [Acidimicrobiales bacterium]
DIKNGAVRSADVADNALTGNDIQDDSLTTSEITDGSLNGNDIAFGTVGGDDILDNSLVSGDIATSTITTGDIAPGGVTPSDLSLQAQTRWAKVGADATPNLIAGRGATSVSHSGAGNFTVNFAQPVTGCGWTATINDNDAGGAPAGQISVERENAGDPDSLRVRTFTAAGAAADLASSDGFTVTVVC